MRDQFKSSVGKSIDHIIDFNAPLTILADWEVYESDQIATRIRGKWTLNQKELSHYISKQQKQGKVIGGNDLRNNLLDKKVVGAQLLDFYLANPHLIPEDYKKFYTFFWGTIYRIPNGELCVRCLYWNGDDRWLWNYFWLNFGFDGTFSALIVNQP